MKRETHKPTPRGGNDLASQVQTNSPARSSYWPVIVLAVFISALVFLVEPLKSALLNAQALHLNPTDVPGALSFDWLLAACLITSLSVGLFRLLGQPVLAVLIALAIGLWAQANLFVWPYGPIDGTAFDWSVHAGKGWLELLVWCSLIAGALVFSRRVARYWLHCVLLLLVLQAAALMTPMLNNVSESSDEQRAVTLEDTDFNLYSSDKNVIVIILDGLQSDIFAEALGDPATSSLLPPGFVFYRNAISHYMLTQFSLPSLLSGRVVTRGGDVVRWRRKFVEASLPARLADEGWDSALMSFSKQLAACREDSLQRCLHPSLLLESPSTAGQRLQRQEVSELFLLSLFRLTPHVFKRWIYDNGEWQLPYLLQSEEKEARDPRILEASRLDLDVIDRLVEDAHAEDVPPRFRFIHLFGAHYPTKLNQSCGFPEAEVQNYREHLVNTTMCLMARMNEYLLKLDEIGIYDSSFIAIIADHGTPQIPVDATAATPPLPSRDEQAQVHLNDAARGLPVLLVKNFNARGAMQVTDQPVALCDVPSSIYDALGLANDTECMSVFSTEGTRPPRLHYRYPNYQQQKKMTREEWHQLNFTPYVVNGHSWWPESWQPYTGE